MSPLNGGPGLRAGGVDILELPAAGHLVMLDQPHRFAVALAGLLEPAGP